jgi:DedD protein
MNDHNLDDLIIDTMPAKNKKTKSALTIIALLIVVLIVAIILTKTLLKSPENAELSFEDNLSTMIAPELKLQDEEEEVTKPKSEPTLSTIIEEKLKEPQASKEKETEAEPLKEEVKVVEEVTEPTLQTISKSETEAEKVPEKPVEVEKTIATKPTTTIEKPVHVKKEQEITLYPKSKVVNTTKYYVQVGSYKLSPSPSFMKILKNSGFKYYMTSPDALGNKKLLIGPYNSRASVDKALVMVRDRIRKSAFVVQK